MIMNETEFYKPVSPLLNLDRLRAGRVAVIGLGSGGCRVAAELGRLGVALLLVDRPGELLEEHNIVRHLLGYSSLGKSKLAEMTAHIRNLNPAAKLEAREFEVVEQREDCERFLAGWRPGVIAVCTDTEPSKHALNEMALRLGAPQTGGAVYDGGIGGEVYRTRPGEACYGCLAWRLRLDRRQPSGSGPRDYSRPETPEAPVTCALNLDIEQIALLQVRLTLDLLLGPDARLAGIPSKANLCVFANRAIPGVSARPWHGEFFRLPRRAQCLSCGAPAADLEARAGEIRAALERPAL